MCLPGLDLSSHQQNKLPHNNGRKGSYDARYEKRKEFIPECHFLLSTIVQYTLCHSFLHCLYIVLVVVLIVLYVLYALYESIKETSHTVSCFTLLALFINNSSSRFTVFTLQRYLQRRTKSLIKILLFYYLFWIKK